MVVLTTVVPLIMLAHNQMRCLPQDRANGQTRSKQSSQATAKTLPQTNEKKQSTTLLSVIGLAMLSLLAVVGLVKKQRKN